jgi:hypothetical protein
LKLSEHLDKLPERDRTKTSFQSNALPSPCATASRGHHKDRFNIPQNHAAPRLAIGHTNEFLH